MSTSNGSARWRAGVAAALLLASGIALGVAVERLWLAAPRFDPMPLTAAALSTRLGLTPAEETRVHELLDSLHTEVSAAAQHGPDSLRVVATEVHRRLEAALPAAARPEFRNWIGEHHHWMMERMRERAAGMPHGGPGRD